MYKLCSMDSQKDLYSDQNSRNKIPKWIWTILAVLCVVVVGLTVALGVVVYQYNRDVVGSSLEDQLCKYTQEKKI